MGFEPTTSSMRPKRSSQLSYTPGGLDTVAPGSAAREAGRWGAVEWFSASDDWLSRWVFERGLAITYVIAFAVVLNQFRPLLGEHGLMPVPRFVAAVPFRRSPSLFHWRYSDRLVVAVGWVGVAVATALLLEVPQRAAAPVAMACWALLWVLYLSVVNVGQRFYSFGWESLLLEVGFLACFLGGSSTEPPVIVMFLLRWLLFRLELGAGLIKLRGDPCWRDLTCLEHHHETQPMPGPLSAYFHHLPKALHRVEVLANHTAQLVVPWFLFAPEPLSTIAAVIIVVTQGYLMISGNFSWLNFLTIALGLSVIDGSVLAHVLPVDPPADVATTPDWQTALTVALAAFVVVRSLPIVANLLSSHQRMNASFDRLHLVNTYGAFGSVTKVRREVIIEGTADERPGARHRVARVRGARQARRRAATASAGRAVPPAPRVAAVVRGAVAELRRRLAPAAASASCSRPTAATLALFDHDPFDGRATGVRARPAVPLRAHDPTGAAGDRRVVATPADGDPPGADGLRPPLSSDAGAASAMIAGPTDGRSGAGRGGTAMPDPVADYETAASGFAERAGAVRRATSSVPSPCEGWTAQDIVDHVMGGPPYYTARVGRAGARRRRRRRPRHPLRDRSPARSRRPAGSRACSSRWCRHRSATARSRPVMLGISPPTR